MSKCIWICARDELEPSIEKDLENICGIITPDNLLPRPPFIKYKGKVALAITNPSEIMRVEDFSLLLGKLLGNEENTLMPEAPFPDGSFALFRDNDRKSEFVSDPAASRTIWYYFDSKLFIGSTSQRAIINVLGNFEINREVIPWMFSTGSLGPGLSWDRRIKCIPPDSSVLLDKETWALREKSRPIEFRKSKASTKAIEESFKTALDITFAELEIDTKKWVQPLSGGYDSRGILLLLKKHRSRDFADLKTLTWGLKASLNDPKNDALVAKRLAERVGVSHEYLPTDLSKEPLEVIFNRFLVNGEGRVDRIGGYLDGFAIWNQFHKKGVQGTIRGDEGFGWKTTSSELTTRLSVGIPLCSDFSNLEKLKEKELSEQKMPAYLERQPAESLEDWRDRLYHQFKLPNILAALSDLKLAYGEQVNPLLSRKILEEVRKQPARMRTEKKLFRKVVASLSPNIPYATDAAIAQLKDVFGQKEVLQLFQEVLASEAAKDIFSEELLQEVSRKLRPREKATEKKGKLEVLKTYIKKNIPLSAYNFLVTRLPTTVNLDYKVLAFRIFIIVRMNSIFKEDCAARP